MTTTARFWQSPVVIVLAVASLFSLTALAVGAGIVDDTYIFLRYARNILEGAGPVFNDGERVEGYSSPLWLVVLTAAIRLSSDPVRGAVAAGAVCGILLVAAVALWDRRQTPWSGVLAALFLACNPSVVFWSFTGMDTALFTLWIVLAVLFFERELTAERAPVVTGALVALAAITRLDGVWVLPLMIAFLVRSRGITARFTSHLTVLVLPTVVVLGTHLLWRHSYYGAWLPNTFAAKVDVPGQVLLAHGARYLALAAVTYAPALAALLLLFRRPAFAKAPAGTAVQPRIQTGVVTLSAAWVAIYALVAGGDHFQLFRFLLPGIALVSLAAGRLAARMIVSGQLTPWLAAAIVVGSNAFVLVSPQSAAARSEVQQARAWADTGRWCAATLPPGSLASMVVGAIPFYCDRPTVDLLGLVDRHIATNGKVFTAAPPGHQKYDTDYVLEKRPSYIFFLSSGMPEEPLFKTVEDRRRWLDAKGHALEDLSTDPRTLQLYDYRAERLANGRFVEFLELRR